MVKSIIMKEYKTKVGKNLIDILMFSMYPDCKIIYREYIQNAFDAIIKAVSKGILSQVKDGMISITTSTSQRVVEIRDNGTGIPSDEVAPLLLNVADSQKDGITQAGQYGIGRLVGAGYCNQLIFETSAKGEKISSQVTFDVVKAREIMFDTSDKSSTEDVIDAITTLTTYETAEEDEHYFIVKLIGIGESYDILLDEKTIAAYIQEVAPIDYSMPFKSSVMQKSIAENTDFAKCYKELQFVKISLNEETDLRKKYGLKVDGTGDRIYDAEFFTIEDDKFGRLAWGWFALTKFTKAIPASDSKRGIRLRKMNIQLGNGNLLDQYFSETRGNNYFYGEIHATHPHLRPDSSRSGLSPTPEAISLFKHLKNYFIELKDVYYLANRVKSAEKDIHTGLFQKSQNKSEGDSNIESAKKKFDKTENSKQAQTDVGKKIVSIYKQDIQSSLKQVQSSQSERDRSSIGDTTFQEKQNKINVVLSTPIVVVKDKFAELQSKLSPSEVWLVRRVFKSLTDNAPTSSRELIEELQKLVIKDLLN